jgi:hypothetical protein
MKEALHTASKLIIEEMHQSLHLRKSTDEILDQQNAELLLERLLHVTSSLRDEDRFHTLLAVIDGLCKDVSDFEIVGTKFFVTAPCMSSRDFLGDINPEED